MDKFNYDHIDQRFCIQSCQLLLQLHQQNDPVPVSCCLLTIGSDVKNMSKAFGSFYLPPSSKSGIKEAIYIRINQPTLNKDGGPIQATINACDPVLTSLLKVRNSRESEHSADEG